MNLVDLKYCNSFYLKDNPDVTYYIDDNNAITYGINERIIVASIVDRSKHYVFTLNYILSNGIVKNSNL